MTDGHGIVVAVDGSPSSDAAVDWAARDAALRHVPLTIVHVQPADEVGPWLDFPVALPQEYLAERDRRSQEIVDDALGWSSTPSRNPANSLCTPRCSRVPGCPH